MLQYVEIGKKESATLASRGACLKGDLAAGFFIKSMVFSSVNNDMSIAREEIFGPVISVIPFEYSDEALHLANAAEYGLGGVVWTQNVNTILKMTNGIKAEVVWVNCYRAIDPSVRFGGYKMSGYGPKAGRRMWTAFCIKRLSTLTTPDASTESSES